MPFARMMLIQYHILDITRVFMKGKFQKSVKASFSHTSVFKTWLNCGVYDTQELGIRWYEIWDGKIF